MRVNVGKLNKRINIVKVRKDKDAAGFWTERDSPVRSCWASFTRTSAKELQKDNADYGEVTARFLIRHTKQQLSRKQVVIYAGNRYEIQYINDYGDSHEFVELLCKQLTKGD